jgi:hypothetical protein
MASEQQGKTAVEVRVLWKGAPVEVREFDGPQEITIGSSPRCDLYLMPEGLPAPEFPIVRRLQGETVLTFTDGMEGEVRAPGGTASLYELVAYGEAEPDPMLYRSYRHRLAPDAEVELRLDQMTLLLRTVPARKRLPRGIFRNVDQSMVNASLATFFGAVTLVASFALFPFDLATKTEAAVRRFTKWDGEIRIPIKQPEAVPAPRVLAPSGQPESAAAAGERGQAGKKDEKKTDGKIAFAPTKESLRDRLAKVGLLAFLRKDGGLFPVGRLSTSDAFKDAMGNIHGREYADAAGLDGLSDRGFGPGGGGETFDSIGLEKIGIPGVPGEGGEGRGGRPVTKLGPKKEVDVEKITGGTPVFTEGLDKELIRQTIHRHRHEIKYCYEKSLNSRPGLWGKVSVTFIVGPTGAVQSAKVGISTLGDDETETCVLSRVRTWVFPVPKGGGIVVVTYPFMLQRT